MSNDGSIAIFISYSRADGDLMQELNTHLSNLKRQGKIRAWYDRLIEAGHEWEPEIKGHLESAQIILLLVSPGFMASDYCYELEMQRAMERHEAGTARVIPILLRPVDWKDAPFSKLQFLPTNGKPVATWDDRDAAFLDVVKGIRGAIESLSQAQGSQPGSLERSAVNPFEYGTTVPPERFYGRREVLAHFRARLGGISPQSVNVVGLRRSGKSSVLRYLRERIGEFCLANQKPLVVPLDLQDKRFHEPLGLWEGVRRGIAQDRGIAPWSPEENGDPFAVEEGLQTLRNEGYRLLILLDEFEAMKRRLGQFEDWGEDWRAKSSAGLLTTVIASLRPLQELYQTLNLTSPFDNLFSIVVLGGLEPEARRDLLSQGFEAEIEGLEALAGGLPYYLQMVGSLLWEHQDWQRMERQFCLQAEPRFGELWQDLTEQERLGLRWAVGQVGLTPDLALRENLQRRGLLQEDGSVWGRGLADFVRRQG
jgi:hypothetical protein